MKRESAEVVIVGGGALGTSVAHHLAELGVADVVLLERDQLGSGSTSKSAGGFRLQFADELNVRIALRSLAGLERLDDVDLRQVGYLFLIDSDGDLAAFREALALQQSLGVPSGELSVEEALALVPQLDPDGLVGATFCPLDGYATPEGVVQAYARSAAKRGIRIRQGEPVTEIRVTGGRIEAVETPSRRIATGTVVCAAGAWSGELAALAGIELPVSGQARWLHYSPASGGLADDTPMTIDFATGFYFHREGPGLVFGGREATLEELAVPASRRLPLLAELPIQASWWGYYEQSPDHNAIVGEVSEPSRFLYGTGFSGHGFQQTPAVGEHLAQLVAGLEPALDLSPFSVDRFGRGELREERFVV
ncbi:MAG: FAD-binding oxidoreductase [Thermoleophilia bacterium]|nr:FAD-binding oxidoreductase [Thermoleophilia bacterium]